ncbi:hypothetical protein THAOC_15106, partial [Thalassiosira oceanica]
MAAAENTLFRDPRRRQIGPEGIQVGATASGPAGPVPPQPPPLPPPQQSPRSVDFGLLQRPSPRTTISDVRDTRDKEDGCYDRRIRRREMTADGMELTGAE